MESKKYFEIYRKYDNDTDRRSKCKKRGERKAFLTGYCSTEQFKQGFENYQIVCILHKNQLKVTKIFLTGKHNDFSSAKTENNYHFLY